MAAEGRAGSVREVFTVFLRLGCTSFGGPVAHLGYFREELVERRGWCSAETYAELIALAQSLPGPASSQVGFAMGILRAGWAGGLAAWLGFTLPSALLMAGFAAAESGDFLHGKLGTAALHGLMLAAIAVVAQAVLAMQRSLAPDWLRLVVAAFAAATMLFAPGQFTTLYLIAAAALVGLGLFRGAAIGRVDSSGVTLSRRAGAAAGLVFVVVFLTAVGFEALAGNASARPSPWVVAAGFYRAGALVFGGGHVVLPMLEGTVVGPGWISQASFLSGYGAAQAMPGPLFTFAAYLGMRIGEGPEHAMPGGVLDATLALMGLFLPGLLAVAAILPFWGGLRSDPRVRAALTGVNAAVVGVLFASLVMLVRPIVAFSQGRASDLAIALGAFVLLVWVKLPSWVVVALCGASAVALSML